MTNVFVLYKPLGGVTRDWLSGYESGHLPLLGPMLGVLALESRHDEEFFLAKVTFDGAVDKSAQTAAQKDSATRGFDQVISSPTGAQSMWDNLPTVGPSWSRPPTAT